MKTLYFKSLLTAVIFGSSFILLASPAETSPALKTCFQENKGQISDQNYKPRPDVLFSGTDGKLVYHLKQNGISYQLTQVSSWKKEGETGKVFGRSASLQDLEPDELRNYRIDINWLNCNSISPITKGKALKGFDNFYLESCPKGALEVKSFASVTYNNIYPGIDLKWYEKNGRLKYDYALDAGADPAAIKLEIRGAQSILVNSIGQLIIKTPLGELVEEAPLVIQADRVLPSKWKVLGNIVSFQISGIDPGLPFTIDPLVRLWGTYYGGSGIESANASSVDKKGNLYISGNTTSAALLTIATAGAFQTTLGGGSGSFNDTYLVKFNSSGLRLWGTYFGGSGIEDCFSCVADTSGDVYVSGGTTSTNSAVMTTAGCHQPLYGGGGSLISPGDAILAKFNASGARIWSTYIGGSGDDFSFSIANDFQNNIYIAGRTNSVTVSTIASPSCHQSVWGGGRDAFLLKFDPTGVRLWGTYYGGTGDDECGGCSADASGNVFIGGITTSSNAISTPGSFQPGYGGGAPSGAISTGDAFLVKFNSAGQRQWGTYYGGTGNELIYSCSNDASGNVFVSGTSTTFTGTTIASPGCHQPTFGGGPCDAFLAKFNTAGTRLWGTYYGAVVIDYGAVCLVDKLNNVIYLSGATAAIGSSAGTAIATSCAYQYTYGGGAQDGMLVKFDQAGNRIWGTYYGGNGLEDWNSLAIDGLGAVYMTGETSNPTGTVLASAGAHQTTYGGGQGDGFIVKFDACNPVTPSAVSTSTVCKGSPIVLSSSQSCGLKWYSDSTLTNLVYTGGNYTTNPITTDTSFYYVDVSCGSASAKAVAHVTVLAGPVISIFTTNSVICKGEAITLVPQGANNYTWANSSSPYTISISPTVATVYTLTGTTFNGGCATKTTIAIQVNECLGLHDQFLSDKLNLQVFPNPSENNFTVSSNIRSEITISNQLGEVVQLADLKESDHFRIVIENLPNGIYFIRAKSESLVRTEKVIVLR